jgi:hypothetical protein
VYNMPQCSIGTRYLKKYGAQHFSLLSIYLNI